jgi:hypothetical protein
MSMMLWVCAAICAVGAVLALLRMPLRAPVTAGTASAKGQSVHAA